MRSLGEGRRTENYRYYEKKDKIAIGTAMDALRKLVVATKHGQLAENLRLLM
jgi:DNA-binding transcriptional MerR regulator